MGLTFHLTLIEFVVDCLEVKILGECAVRLGFPQVFYNLISGYYKIHMSSIFLFCNCNVDSFPCVFFLLLISERMQGVGYFDLIVCILCSYV